MGAAEGNRNDSFPRTIATYFPLHNSGIMLQSRREINYFYERRKSSTTLFTSTGRDVLTEILKWDEKLNVPTWTFIKTLLVLLVLWKKVISTEFTGQ